MSNNSSMHDHVPDSAAPWLARFRRYSDAPEALDDLVRQCEGDPCAGTLDDLRTLVERRLAGIVGPPGPDLDRQFYRLARETSRRYQIDGDEDMEIETLATAARSVRRLVGLDPESDLAAELEDGWSLPIERAAAVAAERAPWALRGGRSTYLADLLDEPETEPVYRIEGLWPHAGRVTLAAPSKAGKSTLIGNLVRALVDGDPLFGEYVVSPLGEDETVYLADVELSRGQLRRWLREQGIREAGRLHVELLRGRARAFDVADPDVRADLAAYLRAHRTRVIIVDCGGPIFDALGINPSTDAAGVGRFLAGLDALAAEAGGCEVLLVLHTGHEGARAAGVMTFRRWPDAEWHLKLTRTAAGREPAPDAPRAFAAFGRDVAVSDTVLAFDPDTRRLSVTAGPSVAEVSDESVVRLIVGERPGLAAARIEDEARSRGVGQHRARAALRHLVETGEVHTHDGPRGARLHHAGACEGECATSSRPRQRTSKRAPK